jgi:hypothetical protein
MHHEFNMEPKSQGYYRPSAEIWAWYSTRIFQASARLNQIPPHDEDPNVTGILNDSWKSYVFFGHSWYWLQAVLHAGNGSQADNNPMDWPYIDGTVIDISTAGPGGHRIPSMQLLNYVVGMQVLYQNTSNTNAYFSGFPFTMVNSGSWRGLWNQTNNTQRTTIWNNVLNKWLDKWNDFTPSELYAIGVATAGQSVQADPGGMGYKIWTNIPRFRHTGVSQSIINALCDFADTVWTNAGDNWNALKTAPCTTEDDDIACTYP